MAQFTNRAQLTYNNIVTMSNLAVGEIQDVLSINKTAVRETYTAQDRITFAINIINSGNTDLSGLTLTDDLGLYNAGTLTLQPLSYIDGTLKYFRNNVLQPSPTVTLTKNGISVTNFTVPAGGTATFLYESATNEFSPLQQGGMITNTAELTSSFTSVSASATISASREPELSIMKSISPVPVVENGTVTYTFIIQNTGNTPADIGAVITDVFDPILSNISVTFNDVQWTAGIDYTYDTTTGLFTSAPNKVTVAAAEYVQDPVTGSIEVIPGTSTLIISGII
ncbi:MAG: hypothetical protein IIY78_07050 [Clostridia bacterium]|nr:hypothetical protein [Clostridia bacterium]